ncbi:MAG TPA: UDP-N-acetylmuramoyl-tripeptide--D-alanyl-D-alanine ligase [Patescibacteria group bacterium]|nr:UDP-N-acetylmuramoyl-tripeptide--D-alanyl-D-alanine ligase [Patescibacteria group bacterium]
MMAEFTIREICKATGAQVIQESAKVFHEVSTDTRTLQPGQLFVALTGDNFDGHHFIALAAEKGAAGAVLSREISEVPPGITVFIVKNTLEALQSLARFHRQRFDIPVIAVTGSNGKTTTKDMLAAALSSRFHVLKTEGNFNNEIGLPLTLLRLTKEHGAAVVEMGMRALGEIRELVGIALPNVAVVTNVGETHMELLGSLENVASAKGELVEGIGENGLTALNADDANVRAMGKKSRGQVVYYGFGPEAFVRAENVRTRSQENQTVTTFDCRSPRGMFPVELPAAGKHNVYNVLAAIVIAWELGLSPQEIQQGIHSFVPSAMRLSVLRRGRYTIVNDAYNASPMSMAAALETLQDLSSGRKVAVLGDMLELGPVAVEAHRRIGRQAANCGVEVVITVGTLAGHIADAAAEAGVIHTMACDTHEQAVRELERRVQPGDTILIKGSRGMAMEKILDLFEG